MTTSSDRSSLEIKLQTMLAVLQDRGISREAVIAATRMRLHERRNAVAGGEAANLARVTGMLYRNAS